MLQKSKRKMRLRRAITKSCLWKNSKQWRCNCSSPLLLERSSKFSKVSIVNRHAYCYHLFTTMRTVDVKAICGADVLTDELLQQIFRGFNTETLQVMTNASGDEKVIISEETQITENSYLDAKRHRVVTVDHVKQSIEGSEEMEPLEHETERVAVETEVAGYVQSHYGQDAAVSNVAEKDGKLLVLLSAEKMNMANFWGGRWMSRYEYACEDRSLSGSVKIRVHYFEDGNVQMSTQKELERTVLDEGACSTPEGIAKAVVEAITQHESSIQGSLEEMYLNMTNQTFKDMRRVLPISKQKMDWSGAQMALAQGFASK